MNKHLFVLASLGAITLSAAMPAEIGRAHV